MTECFHPLKGYVGPGGKFVFAKNASPSENPIQIPCRQCIGCRQNYAQQWAVRCMHEAQMHKENMFLTLTYDDEHLPADKQLNHRHFQLFMKKLRKSTDQTIRYYMCGEYGEQTHRPHYHALIFGYRYPDCKKWRESNNNLIWRSETLEKHWQYGNSEIGSVSYQSAKYCAGYIFKKKMGLAKREDGLYPIVDADSGEIIDYRKPEYTKMSLKPGIGLPWLIKYFDDVFPQDECVIEGSVKVKPPLYYRNWLKKNKPEMAEELREKRIEWARDAAKVTSETRMAQKEQYKQLMAERRNQRTYL